MGKIGNGYGYETCIDNLLFYIIKIVTEILKNYTTGRQVSNGNGYKE